MIPTPPQKTSPQDIFNNVFKSPQYIPKSTAGGFNVGPSASTQNSTTTPTAPTPDPSMPGDTASGPIMQGPASNDPLIGENKQTGIGGSLVQNTIGSHGMAGVASMPGRVIDSVMHRNDATTYYNQGNDASNQAFTYLKQAQTETDPDKKQKLTDAAKSLMKVADLHRQLGDESQNLQYTPEQAIGTALNAGVTAASFGEALNPELVMDQGISGVAKSVAQRAVTQGAIGAGMGAGQAMADKGSTGDILGAAATGGVTGTVAGGVLGAGEAGVRAAAQPVASLVATGVKSAIAQAIGVSPDTVQAALDGSLKDARNSNVSGQDIVDQVQSAVKDKVDELSSTGSKYQDIRNSGESVTLPDNFLKDTLSKYGLGLQEVPGAEGAPSTYKLLTSAESVPLKPGDQDALQRFVDQYGSQSELTANGFLNTRQALDHLSDWDSAKSDVSNRIAKDLRAGYDAAGKDQLTGLAETDAEYAPQVADLNKLKKDYLTPSGDLKDSAESKILNATGKNKTQLLGRLEQLSPGITQKIQVLKSLQEIENASGQKVGAYVHAAAAGGSGYAFATGHPIIGSLLAALAVPKVSVPLLEKYGAAYDFASPAILTLAKKLNTALPLTTKESGFIAQIANQIAQQTNSHNQTQDDGQPRQ